MTPEHRKKLTKDNEYEWYHTQSNEYWNLAESDDRETIIKEGFEYYDLEQFSICRAKLHDFPYNGMFDVRLLDERLIENNEELWGEHQDSIFASKVTKEQESELEAMLIDAFKKWVDKNEIKLEVPIMFEHQIDEETIDPVNFCWVWTHYQGKPLLPNWPNN